MIVLKGGRLIDGTGAAPVEGATVVIDGNRIAAVTSRSDDDHADQRCVAARHRARISCGAEVGTERHVDDVQVIRRIAVIVWIDCVVDCLCRQTGAARAAEYF